MDDRICSSEDCQNLRIQWNEKESVLMTQNKLLQDRIKTLEEINKVLEKKVQNFKAEKTFPSPIKIKLKKEGEKYIVDRVSTKRVKKERAEDSDISYKEVNDVKINVTEQENAENIIVKHKSLIEESQSEEHEYFEDEMNIFGPNRKDVDQLKSNWDKLKSELVFNHDIKTTVPESHTEEHEYFEDEMNIFGQDTKDIDQLKSNWAKMKSELVLNHDIKTTASDSHTEEPEYFEDEINIFGQDSKDIDQLNRNWAKMEAELDLSHDNMTTATESSAASSITKTKIVSRDAASEIASVLDGSTTGNVDNTDASDLKESLETLDHNFVSGLNHVRGKEGLTSSTETMISKSKQRSSKLGQEKQPVEPICPCHTISPSPIDNQNTIKELLQEEEENRKRSSSLGVTSSKRVRKSFTESVPNTEGRSSLNLRKIGRKNVKRTPMDIFMKSTKNKHVLDSTLTIKDVVEGKVLVNKSVKPESYFRISSNNPQLAARSIRKTKYRRAVCAICSRKFATKYALKNHNLMHSVEDRIGAQVGHGFVSRIQKLVKHATRAFGTN